MADLEKQARKPHIGMLSSNRISTATLENATMHDADRYRLLGSYETPLFEYGDVVFCERLGEVQIVGLGFQSSRGSLVGYDRPDGDEVAASPGSHGADGWHNPDADWGLV